MNTVASPNADFAIRWLPVIASSSPFSSWTICMPIPPPPALAFTMTGYPIPAAIFFASSILLMPPSVPGRTGTPASFIICLLPILDPIALIVFQRGPTKVTPSSRQSFANR